MATQRLAGDQQRRRGMPPATQAAGAAGTDDGEPLPALAAVPGLAERAAGLAASSHANSQGGEAVASGGAAAAAAAAVAASTGTQSRRSDLRDSKVQDWLRLAHRSRMGPRLLELRDTQRRSNLPVEKYGLAHVYKLGTARTTWVPEPREWCKDIHRKRDRDGRPIRCTLCTTCHWCRQKSPQVKTQCSACHANRDNVYGGPYAGVICGNCLWTRFGENLHEVQQDPNWLCPACRQICNCSANNCVRSKNGWVPTNQLISEAESLGYESVAHYLVLSQLDESLLANITDNVHSLQPLLDQAQVARRLEAAKRQRNERDEAIVLRTAAEAMVDRELAVIRAATGLTDERVNAVAARNQQVLAALGFGHGTLAADLMDDDDDEDELLPSPAAARGGSVAPAASALGPAGSRGSAVAGSSALQQVLQPSLGATGLTQLSGSLGASGISLAGSGLARRRLPPRRPGEGPSWLAAGLVAAAGAGAAAVGASPALGQWASPTAAALPMAQQLGPASASAPAAAAANVAPSGSSGLLATAGGGQSVAGGASVAAEGTADTAVTAGGASAAEPERQERLDGLLQRDANAAFPAGLPEGDDLLPGLALGLRPAPAQGLSRQAGAPGLPPSGQSRQPLRPHLQQQQARLTPVAAIGSKQARAALDEPGAGGRVAAAGQQAVHPMETGEAAEQVRGRSVSPVEVAEPSQQLGLSPGVVQLNTAAAAAAAQQAGDSPAAAGGGAVLSPPVATTAPGDAAVAGAPAPAKKRDLSSPAADWRSLHQAAHQLVEEVWMADPACEGFSTGLLMLSEEQAAARHKRVYERNMQRILEILAKANSWLTEPLVVLSTEGVRPIPHALLFDALQEMVYLYNSLATMLPDDDVWQVVQRLVCQDCFVDCERSHWSARMVLLKAWIELRETLSHRKLIAPLHLVYHAMSDVVASLAEDLCQLRQLLGLIQQGLHGNRLVQLPEQDQRIGPYHYNAAERARGLSQLSEQLQGMCSLVEKLLYESLELCQAVAEQLQHDAMHLISHRLMAAVLGGDRGMTHRNMQAGMQLVFLALRFSCLKAERQHGLQLSVTEINRRREERLRMCQVVKDVLPLLEKVVAVDYPLWRPAGAPMGAARQEGQAALSTGAASGPAFMQTITGGLNTLAQAYAFLMECGQMNWQELEGKAIQPYNSPATFWQLSNRMYRGFGMSLMADTLQLVSTMSLPDPRARTRLLRHWLLCLLDRSRRFNTGEKLTLVLSQLPQTQALLSGLEPAQLAIAADGLGQHTAVVLCHVMRALVRDLSWRPHLPELLQGLDELLERRDKEVAATDARSRADRLRYGARLYRLLGAILLAATPLMPLPPAITPVPTLASTVDQLRRLAQRMAMLVVGSCLAVQREYAAQRAARAAAGRVGLAALDVEDELGSALRSLGDVRQRLQVLPFGQLGVLWQVLLAWGVPAACQTTQRCLKPVAAVVGCALELCSGEKDTTPFDQAVLQRLADSLLVLPEDQQLTLRQANPGAASLAQLREFVLATLLRRYLARCHIPTEAAQRSAVNAVRLLEMLLLSLRGEEAALAALLPLLWSLLDALRPRIPPEDPFNGSGTQEAILSMLARVLEQGGPLAQLLPPLAGPPPGTGRAAVVCKVLHGFWSAAASDALLCVKQPVWRHLDEPRRQLYCSKLLTDGPPRLLPRDMDPAANAAVNTVSGLCGRLAQQWTVNVEQLCIELSKQLDLLRREAAAPTSGTAAPLPLATFRPADFNWALAHSALHLFSSFLLVGRGKAPGQPSPPLAEAAAAANSLRAGGDGGAATAAPGSAPAAAEAAAEAAAALGRPQRWQDLLPGQQWAFGCLFAPARLVLVGLLLAKPLQKAYLGFQEGVQEAVGPLMPKGVCMAPRGARQPGAAQPPPAGAVQPQPEASCLGGNSVVAGPSAGPRTQPTQLPQQGRSLALPAASGIGVSGMAGRPAQQQRVQVKLEPVSQLAGPAGMQSRQPPAALGPRHQAQRLDRDVSFAELAGLPSHSLVQLVGYLRRRPAVKEGKKGRVLQLDLRDHKQRRLALLVQQADEPQLFDQLLAEAMRRFDSQPNQLHVLRASNATLLESTAGGSVPFEGSAAAATSSRRASSANGSGRQYICLLKQSGRHVPSVGWDPTGERAALIRQACADGLVRLEDQQAGPPALLATQATVLQPSVHRPETQVTPAMHWTPQLQADGSPGATQVADAGGEEGARMARWEEALLPANQAAMSQAPVAAERQRGGADATTASTAGAAVVGKTPWQQLALAVAALLQPQGFSRLDAIKQVKRFDRDRDAWVARGAHALATEICRQAGKPLPPP